MFGHARTMFFHSDPWMVCRRMLSQDEAQDKQKNKSRAVKAIERNNLEKLMFGGVVETKAEKTKRLRKEKLKISKPKEPAPNSEEYWLANLDRENVKLFRKTSGRRYKEINKDKLFSALGLVPNSATATAPGTSCDNEENNGNNNNNNISNNNRLSDRQVVRSVTLPDIIIKNITSYPLLFDGSKATKQPTSMENGSSLAYPSVTHILNQTMSQTSRDALDRWKKDLIAQLGDVGFQKHQQALLDQGTSFHACVRRYLETREEASLHPSIEGCWNSIESVLKEVSHVQALESRVSHPTLLYKGVVDCVASYQGRPCVMEWKKSDKPKVTMASTYDAPLQLCAYLGALSHASLHQQGPPIEHGVVVVAYTDGSPANVFQMDLQLCLYYWGCWLTRLQTYWQKTS